MSIHYNNKDKNSLQNKNLVFMCIYVVNMSGGFRGKSPGQLNSLLYWTVQNTSIIFLKYTFIIYIIHLPFGHVSQQLLVHYSGTEPSIKISYICLCQTVNLKDLPCCCLFSSPVSESIFAFSLTVFICTINKNKIFRIMWH